ncbi:hypothetical protein CGCF413_v007955 [Colletotrichum fructicola]|nr:hypothetical protein CGCF413_v007955 [Colletotrichum fructicola]
MFRQGARAKVTKPHLGQLFETGGRRQQAAGAPVEAVTKLPNLTQQKSNWPSVHLGSSVLLHPRSQALPFFLSSHFFNASRLELNKPGRSTGCKPLRVHISKEL